MKNINFIIIFALICTVSCTNKTSNNEENVDTLQLNDSEPEDFFSRYREGLQYINSVKGHKEQDIIIGKFVDNNIDTLWFECCDMETYKVWELCCSNKNVKRCKFWAVSPSLVFEGDLDGNGTDDFGFLDTWDCSDCRNYNVATIKNHQIICMLSLETARSLRSSGKELVKKSNKKGYAHVVYSDMYAPGACCSSAPDKDTLMKFEYQEFDQSDFE